MRRHDSLRAMYLALFRAWGRQHWWPAEFPFEVVVGAFLTQNTAWTNVEKAMAQLRQANALSLEAMRRLPLDDLELLIRSSGFFRQKAARLKGFIAFLDREYGGSLQRMFAAPTTKLREQLLALGGVGQETADSILLYGGNHPVFVVDAYTRRILDRHGVLAYNAPYEEIRLLCESALGDAKFVATAHQPPLSHAAVAAERQGDGVGQGLPVAKHGGSGARHEPSTMSSAQRSATAQVFNEMHGLFVGVAKRHCLKSKALCGQCPLASLLTRAQEARLRKEGLLTASVVRSS